MSHQKFKQTRRAFLRGGLATGTLGLANFSAHAEGGIVLAPQTGKALLRTEAGAQADVLAYGTTWPSPVLRVKQSQPFKATITNRLEQDTTVHWHGIRLPNAMDGVPNLTQPPIPPGGIFTYAFTPPDAGTFWYHPHANSLEQMGRGLAGLLIVEEEIPQNFDRDIAWLLQDWRLDDAGQIAGRFGSMMDAAMAGHVGNSVTINGAPPIDLAVRPNERIRLRLANASLARIYALNFSGLRPLIIATDGQPCEPHEPEDGVLLIGPAMRIDIVLDGIGKSGEAHAIRDTFYDSLSYTLCKLRLEGVPLRYAPLGPVAALPSNPLPMPNLTSAIRQEIILQGGMMGGGKFKGMGGMMGQAMPGMNGGPVWAINGMSMTGEGAAKMEPAFSLQRGQTCLLAMRNDTAWAHTMHIHGFSTRLLSRNGKPVPHNQWHDTIYLGPADRIECAFVADNPGDWMLHCHITDHQMAGLMTLFRVT